MAANAAKTLTVAHQKVEPAPVGVGLDRTETMVHLPIAPDAVAQVLSADSVMKAKLSRVVVTVDLVVAGHSRMAIKDDPRGQRDSAPPACKSKATYSTVAMLYVSL